MKGKQYSGLLDKIKLIRKEPLLIRFSLINDKETINCLVANKELATAILALPNKTYFINIVGYRNLHNQFVVKSIAVNNPDEITKLLDLS